MACGILPSHLARRRSLPESAFRSNDNIQGAIDYASTEGDEAFNATNYPMFDTAGTPPNSAVGLSRCRVAVSKGHGLNSVQVSAAAA
jgi:hypothetical protein